MRGSELVALPVDVQRAIALVKMRVPDIAMQTEVQSPCISVCRMSDNSGLCMGCFRTRDEIAGWSSSGDDGKRDIWKLIEQRMDGLLGSDANFMTTQNIAPEGRAKGTMNLGSNSENSP